MAIDTRQKRAAVIGTARAWYRNPHPSSIDASQRASIGQVYPVAVFSNPTPVTFKAIWAVAVQRSRIIGAM